MSTKFKYKVLPILILVGLFSSNYASARESLLDTLKDFFKAQIGSVDFSNVSTNQIPPAPQKTTSSSSSRNVFQDVNSNVIVDNPAALLNPDIIILNPDILRGGPSMMSPYRLNPAIAYDPIMQRYLMVWEQKPDLVSSQIYAQYINRNGEAQGMPVLVSTDRTTQGCLYAGFATDRPGVTVPTPENCQQARNPSVAYSNGKFLIVWELGGTASHAYNASYRTEMREGRNVLVRSDATPTPNEEGRTFSNIIAKMVNADDRLTPANPSGRDGNWDEGILISQFNLSINQDYVYNSATNSWVAFDPTNTSDIDIQAWWVSKHPKVEAFNRMNPSDPSGFVVTWDSNRGYTDCREPVKRGSTAVYSRYIDENFLAQIPAGMTNPNRPVLALSRDASADPANSTSSRCGNDVVEIKKPKIAVLANNDIVTTYETNSLSISSDGSSNRGPSRIGLKKISLSNLQGTSNENVSTNFATVFPSMGMENQKNPQLLNYQSQLLLAYDDDRSIYFQRFNSSPELSPNCPMGGTCNPTRLVMEGDAAKTHPVLAHNLSGSACTGASAGMEHACRPDALALSYLEADRVKLAFLDANSNFSPLRTPLTLSSESNNNIPSSLASDGVDFFAAWTGVVSARTNIFHANSHVLADMVAPTLGMPNSDATLGSTTVDFSWNHPGGEGIRYTLYLAQMGSSLMPVSSCSNVSRFSCTLSSGLSFGNTYQWRVEARDSRYTNRVISSAETRSFSLAVDALAAPVLTSPAADVGTLNNNSVNFTWSHPGGSGIQYTLQLSPMGLPLANVATCTNITTQSCRVDGLTWGQSYQWRVTARDASMPLRTSVSAETRSFRLEIESLPAPVLTSPAVDAGTLNSNAVDFSWTHPGGSSIQYSVQLAPMGSPLVDTPTCTNVTVQNCRVEGLTWGQSYQWRVSARDASMPLRTSVSAETRNFSIIGNLSAPTLISPENLASLNMMSVTLQWSPIASRPTLVYDVFVDDVTNMSSPVMFARRTDLTTTSTTISGLSGNKTYQWWVVARDATGMNVESDSRRTFRINDLNPPTAPVLAAQPANNVTWAPTRLYLSWAAATDPDMGDSIVGYDVYFVEGTSVPSDACPYKRVSTTNFIIQASTDGRSAYVPDMSPPAGITCNMSAGGARPIYLRSPDSGMMSRNYAWKICAVNNNGARTCSEERRFNTDDSVVGWWRFDENPAGPICPSGLGAITAPAGDAGETVCDYSGKGNHGVPHGNPTWLPPVTGGMASILGAALQFDGVDDWVEVANSVSLNPSREITLEVNQRLQSFGGIAGNRPLIQKITTINATDNTGYDNTFFGTNGDYYFQIGNRTVFVPIRTVIEDWKHLVGTFDGANGKIYSDGILLLSSPLLGAINPNSQPLWIGKRFPFSSPSFDFYNGNLNDIIIYSRAITAGEIQNNFLSR